MVLRCPQCNAPLAPSRFARQVTCTFCGTVVEVDPSVVSVQRFKDAHAAWNAPESYGFTRWFTVGEQRFTEETLVAHGEISDVYRAIRARWPSETVLVKVLRRAEDADLLDNEWSVLNALRSDAASGSLAPIPIAQGTTGGSLRPGARATVLRWPRGIFATFDAVRAKHPRGVPAEASIWAWRRILEALTGVHRSGLVHGAVLPQHLLVEGGKHGVRLVDYSCAGKPGTPLLAVCTDAEAYYPRALLDGGKLAPEHDVAMSARCVAFLLGGDAGGGVPSAVPPRLAALLEQHAARGGPDAWALREEVGSLGRALFGPPAFHPISI